MLSKAGNISFREKFGFYVFVAVVIWNLLISLVKGWNGVYSWIFSNWMMSYEWGFTKRAVIGEVTSWIGVPPESYYSVILWTGLCNLVVLLCTACWLMVKMENTSLGCTSRIVLLMFSVSPFISMSANLIGYLDFFIYLGGILAIFMVHRKLQILGSVLVAGLMFVHEMTLLLIYPLFFISLIMVWNFDEESIVKNINWKFFFSAVLPLFGFLFVILFQTDVSKKPGFEKDFVIPLAQAVSYEFSGPEAYESSISAARYFVSQLFTSYDMYLEDEFKKGLARIVEPADLFVVFWFLSVVYLIVWNVLRSAPYRNLLAGLAFLSVLSPILLHFIAYDTPRFWTMPIMLGLLLIWVVSHRRKFTIEPGQRFLIELLAILGMAYYIGMKTYVMVGVDVYLYYDERYIKYAPALILAGYYMYRRYAFDLIQVETDIGSQNQSL
ncbi:hypothetical protein [Oceanobacter mangrovi]|uniref:hypothetical protein n=1 Tax=Oceanobacter mangrovi TaxID=2862510 RepID=UPI001C8DF51E|nr:hypothetical protein [Oceanobacter mangrovi]